MRIAQVATATLVAILTFSALHTAFGHRWHGWHHRHSYYDRCDEYDHHGDYRQDRDMQERNNFNDTTYKL